MSEDIFNKIDRKVLELKNQGIDVIDLGVGDPAKIVAPPQYVINSLSNYAEQNKHGGYPRSRGDENFLQTCANYMQREFNVVLNPATEINITSGSKEAVYHFPKVMVKPNDIVICPTPGYPPFHLGTLAAHAKPYFVPLYEENNFLPDFAAIPEEIAQQAKMIWINYPNSPTGTMASLAWYEKFIAWAHKYNIVIAADEGAYIEIYYEKKCPSILEVSKQGIVAFYSLSKRNNMTGYRIGFVAGDARIIEEIYQLKTHQDNGVPQFIQGAATLALADTEYIRNRRAEYKIKKEIIVEALTAKGLPRSKSEATFFIWQKAPAGMSGLELAEKLLDLGIVVIPGTALTQAAITYDKNPGQDFVRIALMPSINDIKKAAQRILNDF